jgi:hypothetical protein
LIVLLSSSCDQVVDPRFVQDLAVFAGLGVSWAFFGGVKKRLVPHDMRTMVTVTNPLAPVLADVFLEYAQARGILSSSLRPSNHPATNRGSRTMFRTCARVGSRASSSSLRKKRGAMPSFGAASTLAGGSTELRVALRREHHEVEEQPHMLPPPAARFDVPTWTKTRVHSDHLIKVKRVLCSLPTRSVGRVILVRVDSALVQEYSAQACSRPNPVSRPDSVDRHERLSRWRERLRVVEYRALHRGGGQTQAAHAAVHGAAARPRTAVEDDAAGTPARAPAPKIPS